ncbi:hypothetical protein JD77_05126 [Micromonospora olivasterospora]|uniref:Uncharacterized protein n=1 Tax=Micromonospora olivasterospora TaxID=1880 RepID=A0A562IHA7_MICOL|nr:hypothetical protein JD77_05126 [Micromonospora olivasterospora]
MRLTVTPDSLKAELVSLGGQVDYWFLLRKGAQGRAYLAERSDWVDPDPPTESPDPTRYSVSFDLAAGSTDGLTYRSYEDGPYRGGQPGPGRVQAGRVAVRGRGGQPMPASRGTTRSASSCVNSTGCRSGIVCTSVTPSAAYSATSARNASGSARGGRMTRTVFSMSA